MANTRFAREILAAIKADPASWDQSFWRTRHACGTAACFAGRAGILRGVPWLTGPDGRRPDGSYLFSRRGVVADYEIPAGTAAGLISAPGQNAQSSWCAYSIPDALTVAQWAARELGITTRQAQDLFAPGNSLPMLEAMVDALEADPDADLLAVHDAYVGV